MNKCKRCKKLRHNTPWPVEAGVGLGVVAFCAPAPPRENRSSQTAAAPISERPWWAPGSGYGEQSRRDFYRETDSTQGDQILNERVGRWSAVPGDAPMRRNDTRRSGKKKGPLRYSAAQLFGVSSETVWKYRREMPENDGDLTAATRGQRKGNA